MIAFQNLRHCTLGIALSLFGTTAAVAQTTTTTPTAIIKIGTGWSNEAFSAYINQALINPANCVAADFYGADTTVPGYSTHYAAALTAFSTGKLVTFVISNTACSQGRPMIVGLYVNQ